MTIDCVQDRDTLLSCALVQQSWLYRSRDNLFSEICIDGPEKLREFAEFVSSTPAVASRVKSLTLRSIGRGRFRNLEANHLVQGLENLPRLTSLRLLSTRVAFGRRPPTWTVVRSLRRLRFNDTNASSGVLIRMLSLFSHFEVDELSFGSNMFVTSYNENLSFSRWFPSRWRVAGVSLEEGIFDYALRLMTAALDPSTLRRVMIAVTQEYSERLLVAGSPLHTFFQTMGPSLKYLRWDASCLGTNHGHAIGSSVCTLATARH